MKTIFIAYNMSMENYDLYKEYCDYINTFKGFHILSKLNITDHNCTKDLFKMSDCILKLKEWGTNNKYDEYELNMAKEMEIPIYDEYNIEDYLLNNKL